MYLCRFHQRIHWLRQCSVNPSGGNSKQRQSILLRKPCLCRYNFLLLSSIDHPVWSQYLHKYDPCSQFCWMINLWNWILGQKKNLWNWFSWFHRLLNTNTRFHPCLFFHIFRILVLSGHLYHLHFVELCLWNFYLNSFCILLFKFFQSEFLMPGST